MSPYTHRALALSLLTAAVALAGCHEPTETSIPTYTYTGTDYSFEGPDEMEAGWVQLTLVNGGQEPHHVQLFRLTEGKTQQDYRDAIEGGELHPDWIEAVGGPNTPGPGGESSAVVHLEPGEYVMVCEIPDREGTPHLLHGMIKDVTVSDEDGAAEPPEADLTVLLRDFSFEKQGDWSAGEHTIAARNEGGQPHEAVLVRYHENGNFSELLRAFGPNATGPPPADFLGGLSGIASGDTAFFTADLTPGRYGFICFLEDPQSHAPHFALGMEQEFAVQ